MFIINHRKLLITISFIALSFNISIAHAVVDLSKNFPYQGQITSVDKMKRLLTIEAMILKGNKTRQTLTIKTKTYKIAVGAKLNNMPKSQQYSGLKNLMPGTMISFKLKRGSEKNKMPTITEMWVDLQ